MQQTQTPEVTTLRFRADQFRLYGKARGIVTDNEIAAAIGLDRSTVYRLLSGDNDPGKYTIAAILAAFPDRKFEDFFEVTTVQPRARRPAA
jgi:transcriptional regulator with XRE-family HTH domain